MRLQFFIAIIVFTGAPFAFAAPSCGTYTVVGSQCETTVNLGWGTAGLGTDSLIGVGTPLTLSAPATFQLSQLNSSRGAGYTGYFGILASFDGATPQIFTLANSMPVTLTPGEGFLLQVTKVCFDPTCTVAAPAGAVPNMFSLQLQVLAASATDMAKLFTPLLTVRFLDSNGIVTDEEQEKGLVGAATTMQFGLASVNEAATPATRYMYSGSAVTLPYDVFSVTNPSATQSISGTVNLYDYNDNLIATANIPAIPPLGAAGYILFGRAPGDTLGLFPSSMVLPSPDSQGIFHGALSATFSAPAIFLAQEFNGNAMLNLVIF